MISCQNDFLHDTYKKHICKKEVGKLAAQTDNYGFKFEMSVKMYYIIIR